MIVDQALMEYLQTLARLRLEEDEQESVAENLRKILGYMEQLGRLDTEGVQPLSHPFSSGSVLREDREAPSWQPDLLLAEAPEQKDGCFRVPKTVE